MKKIAENNTKTDQVCELIQLSISTAIDSNEKLNHSDTQHIETCHECAEFHQHWNKDSSLSTIASGILVEQQNLTHSIISHLKQSQNPETNTIRGKFFKAASIAAIIAIAATFTFWRTTQDEPQNEISLAPETPAKEQLTINLPEINIHLTEAVIEQTIEKNFQQLSEAATDKWRTATTSISIATEYIVNGTHYISNKYLVPKKDTPSSPQTQLEHQLTSPNPHQHG